MLATIKTIALRGASTGAALLALISLSACHDDGIKNQPSHESHRQIQPRNPDVDNHETLRVLRRDDLWRLLELDIYKTDAEVQILKDPANGINTGGNVHLQKGPSFSFTADNSGKRALKAELKAANGELIASQEQIERGVVKTVVPFKDDVTAELVNYHEGQRRVITVRQGNGTPVFEIEMAAGLKRVSMKLYSASGQLLYEETRSEEPLYGLPTVYTAYIHGPQDGHVTHRVTIKQLATQNDPGSLDLVETMSDDGKSVIATAETRWDDEKSVSCGVFGDQKGLQAKLQEVFGSVKLIMDVNMEVDRAVITMLSDRTR